MTSRAVILIFRPHNQKSQDFHTKHSFRGDILNHLDAFMLGIKPACLLSKADKDDRVSFNKLIASELPKVEINSNLTLFFQNEKLKQDFLDQYQDIEFGTNEYHHLIGLTLGFPPKAVDYFVRSLIDQRLWEQSVRFDYLGYIFSGHKDDVQAIAEWLWSNVPAPPSSVKVTKINGETFFVHPKP